MKDKVSQRILSPQEAETRVAQVRALTDPRAIRVLTFVAASPLHAVDPASLPALTDETPEATDGIVNDLIEVDLLKQYGSSVTITDSAWLRYRRLLLEKTMSRAVADIGWSRYPTAVKRLASQLSLRFERTFNSETIAHYVKTSYDDLHSRAVIGNHLVLLTSRLVHDRLGTVAASRGIRLSRTPRVLFVCTHNSGRSQLATALLRERAQGLAEVSSAGVEAHKSVNAHVYTALAEMGVPPMVDPPSLVDRAAVSGADIVVTMGCGDVCPIVPGPRYLDWPIEDPALRGLAGYRQALREIDTYIETLLREFQ